MARSPSTDIHDAPDSRLRQTAMDILLLLVTTWACHFLQASRFGLYEDDWWRIPLMADISLRGLWSLLRDFLILKVGQGRPLHDVFIYLLSFLGWRLGGLRAVYWIGYSVLALNVTLLYALLRRMSGHRFLALSGSLAFVVFPADTTRQFLTHALGVQPSLTFLLVACHAYLSRWRALSYVVAAACLMSYETFFLVFLSMPLVRTKWDRQTMVGLAKHGLIMGTLILATFILRHLTGEPRVASLVAKDMLFDSVRALTFGPFVSMAQYFRGPIGMLMHLGKNASVDLCAVVLLCGAAFTWRLSRHMRGIQLEERPHYKVCEGRLLHLEVPRPLFELGKVAVLGVTMLILAYPLALTVSPLATSGRATRVHAAAAVGAAVLFGALSSAFVFVAKLYEWERIATFGLGASLALLAGFSVSVQSDYSLGWSLQRTFWTQFVRLSPSASDGSVFLVDPLKDTTRISAFSWSTVLVLERIYRLPDSWQSPDTSAHPPLRNTALPPPRVFMFGEVWRARYCAGQELFESSGWFTRDFPSFVAQYGSSPPKVRVIRSSGNGLTLGNSPCACTPDDRSTAPGAIKITELARRPMYTYLIR
jgi:hypothetical protein